MLSFISDAAASDDAAALASAVSLFSCADLLPPPSPPRVAISISKSVAPDIKPESRSFSAASLS